MDGEFVIGILMVIFWLISSLVARFGRAARGRGAGEPVDERQADAQSGVPLGDALRDLAKQMGLEEAAPVERPVASEHTLTPSEHRRSAGETMITASEHVGRPSDHRRTASEARLTASEHIFERSEHQLTASEHRRGDVDVWSPPPADLPPRRGKSVFVAGLHRELAGGPRALARAVLLREILGPPVSLRERES